MHCLYPFFSIFAYHIIMASEFWTDRTKAIWKKLKLVKKHNRLDITAGTRNFSFSTLRIRAAALPKHKNKYYYERRSSQFLLVYTSSSITYPVRCFKKFSNFITLLQFTKSVSSHFLACIHLFFFFFSFTIPFFFASNLIFSFNWVYFLSKLWLKTYQVIFNGFHEHWKSLIIFLFHTSIVIWSIPQF